MNKQQFMHSLLEALPDAGVAERADIIADFEEHFASGLAYGKTEEQICSDLGSPYEIARQYREDIAGGETPLRKMTYPIQDAPAEVPQSSPAKPTLNSGILIIVILFNLMIGIPILISLFSTLLGLWITAGGMGVAAIALFAVAIVQAGIMGAIIALFALALISLTVLAAILMAYITKWLCIGLVKYINWNRRLVMGGQPA